MAIHNALCHRYLAKNWIYFYELNTRKITCIIGNAITLQIILRNESPENNNLLKVKST